MNKRERISLSLLKNIFDSYNDLTLKQRGELSETTLCRKIDEIPSALKLFKSEIGKEISVGVVVSKVNKRFVRSETEIMVL